MDITAMDSRASADFDSFLREIGVSNNQMNLAKLAFPEPVWVEYDKSHLVLPSAIEGLGVFSGFSYKTDDQVCTLKVGAEWATAGRYINHHPEPNLVAISSQNTLQAVARHDIKAGSELTLDYRQVKDALEAELSPAAI